MRRPWPAGGGCRAKNKQNIPISLPFYDQLVIIQVNGAAADDVMKYRLHNYIYIHNALVYINRLRFLSAGRSAVRIACWAWNCACSVYQFAVVCVTKAIATPETRSCSEVLKKLCINCVISYL